MYSLKLWLLTQDPDSQQAALVGLSNYERRRRIFWGALEGWEEGVEGGYDQKTLFIHTKL